MRAEDGDEGDGVLHPNLVEDLAHPYDINYNDALVRHPQVIRHGFPYRYKICGLATLDSAPLNTHKNKKFVCYNGNPISWVF